MLTKALTTGNHLEYKLLFYKMISTYDTGQAVTGRCSKPFFKAQCGTRNAIKFHYSRIPFGVETLSSLQLGQQFFPAVYYGGTAALNHFFKYLNNPQAQAAILFREVRQGLQ